MTETSAHAVPQAWTRDTIVPTDWTVTPQGWRVYEGRPCSAERRRVAVLSPYFPFPLSHGGAVRIYNLLREAAREFDIELFAFTDGEDELELLG